MKKNSMTWSHPRTTFFGKEQKSSSADHSCLGCPANVTQTREKRKMFSSGLRKGDIEQVLGDAFACCIPNDYGLVREAIDRGVPLEEIKPGNNITVQLKRLMLPQPAAKAAGEGAVKKFKLSWAR